MDIKDQVCSLELSMRLKELGYPQKGVFWWWRVLGFKKYRIWFIRESLSKRKKTVAPTVAELGMALPYRLRLEDDDYWLQIFKEDDFWEIKYFGYKENIPLRVGYKDFSFQDANEANTRGLMWEFLKKNNFLEEGE